MFSTDNLVVYPAYGIGQIECIEHKDIGGRECEFYIVRIRASNIVMMVPVKNAANVGLRSLITKKMATRILQALRIGTTGNIITGQNWNRRFREYSGRLKSPDLNIVAEVLHELLLISRGKELSFGERRLLEQAMNLVCGELAEVLNISLNDLRTDLLSLYAPISEEEIISADA